MRRRRVALRAVRGEAGSEGSDAKGEKKLESGMSLLPMLEGSKRGRQGLFVPFATTVDQETEEEEEHGPGASATSGHGATELRWWSGSSRKVSREHSADCLWRRSSMSRSMDRSSDCSSMSSAVGVICPTAGAVGVAQNPTVRSGPFFLRFEMNRTARKQDPLR